MRKILAIAFLAVCLLAAGCQSVSRTSPAQVSGEFARLTDSAGRTVILPQKPQKIVALSTSFLELLYAVDGKAIGRVSSKTDLIPAAAQNLPEVGFVYNINLEQLVALQPDLVIAVQGMHEKLIPSLEANHIPVVVLKYKTLGDTFETIKSFGQLAGTEAKAEQLSADLEKKTQDIVSKVPSGTKPKVAILHATAKSVTIEQDNTIAGSLAKKLGLVNITAQNQAALPSSDTVPYSLEKLVENDPDVLLVVTMGNQEDIQKRMKSDVESSPAWQTLRAVKQGKIYFLPSELFLLNPGLKMPDAVQYMAKLIYPEVYGHVQ